MIIPALLTDDKRKLEDMLNLCSSFSDFLQIDIMDGKFVPSRSIKLEEINQLKSPIDCEAHLMVAEPMAWVKTLRSSELQG
ncbi:MAG: hypothetical protein GF375_00865 [Candidatus Omnitrophica bacterium]|nr:hypothetical protein [Candidatus Omnitrophota bacterium]MBD3268698.1 hypothetical protein [Candidatus Omnitrophota bacterium]